MFCSNCGSQVNEGKFCSKCGKPIVGNEVLQEKLEQQPEYQPTSEAEYQPPPEQQYQQPPQQYQVPQPPQQYQVPQPPQQYQVPQPPQQYQVPQPPQQYQVPQPPQQYQAPQQYQQPQQQYQQPYQQYQAQPQYYQQPNATPRTAAKPGGSGAVVFTIIVFIAASVLAFLVYFNFIDNKMMELIIAIAVLVVALVTAIIALRGSQIKTLIRVIAIISVIIAAGALALSFFESDESKIARRIDTFSSAMNNGDLNGAIECFDPATRNTMKAATGIGNSILGGLTGLSIDIADIFGLIMGFGAMTGHLDVGFSLTVVDVDIKNDTTAIAYVRMVTSYGEETFPIPMVKDGMDWFIDIAGSFGGLW